eukprot:356451-Chlamydomonas_euryale.AAC.7
MVSRLAGARLSLLKVRQLGARTPRQGLGVGRAWVWSLLQGFALLGRTCGEDVRVELAPGLCPIGEDVWGGRSCGACSRALPYWGGRVGR